jgi:cytochrome c biogenesis protein CcmG/thiol:disulfide interchange protein DsbE
LPNVRDGASDVAYVPGKPTVVNFWASWCTPCQKEMPAFERASKDYAGKIAFVGIDSQDARVPAVAFLDDKHITYPSAYDPKGTLLRRFKLRQGLPQTLFLDSGGKVVDTVVGQVAESALQGKLRRLEAA